MLPGCSTPRQVLQSMPRDLFLGTLNSSLCSPKWKSRLIFLVTSREGAANAPLRFEHLNVLPAPVNWEGISTGRRGVHGDCSPRRLHFRGSFRFVLEHRQWPVTSAKDIKRNEAEKIRESPLLHTLYDTNNKSLSQLRTCKVVYQKRTSA